MKKIFTIIMPFVFTIAGIFGVSVDVNADEKSDVLEEIGRVEEVGDGQEQASEMDAVNDAQWIEDYIISADEELNEGEIDSVDEKHHNKIFVFEEFIGSHHEYGKTIKIPFTFFCYGDYNNEKWYVNIYDVDQNLLASADGYFPLDGLGVESYYIIWDAKKKDGTYYEPGLYYVNFYSSADYLF